MKDFKFTSAVEIAQQLGERLKQARLNKDMTQTEVAAYAGVSRKTVLNAEKGKVQLENLVAILQALELTDQLERFLSAPALSPIQLAKLQGRQRQRASGQRVVTQVPADGEGDW